MSDRVITWARCARVIRTDAVVIAFTEHDRDIAYDGVTYLSSASYSPSTKDMTATLSVNNSDMQGYFAIAGVEKDDVVKGLYDGAQVYELLVDYTDLSLVKLLGKGRLGEVEIKENGYSAEFRSLTQQAQQPVGSYYTAECPHQLGDTRCGISLAGYTDTGSVTSVSSNQIFADSAIPDTHTSDDYYKDGLLTFTSGANSGIAREVKSYVDATGTFTTFLPFPYVIAASDTFTVYAGCDKRKTTCITKFTNVLNYGGFDMIPGQGQINKFGGQ